MTRQRIERTGKSSLAFDGEVVASVDGCDVNGKEQNRYHDLALWRTDTGKYVLDIQYVTKWRGELGYRHAEIVEPGEVAERLRAYDPCAHVQGFPDRPEYADRQVNLLNWIRSRYDVQVGELLAQVEDLDDVI